MGKCDFRIIQRQFTRAIRAQGDYTPPCEAANPIEARRFAVYRELFLNTVSQFFANVYPTCHDVLGETRWMALMRAFLAEHGAQTPYFHFLGQEFLTFLQSRAYVPDADPPWLSELADWEWRELEVSIETAPSPEPIARLMPETVCRLSPAARLCAYDWPVHQAAAGVELVKSPTFLLVWRDAQDEVHFAQLAPMMAALLDALDGEQPFQVHLAHLGDAWGQTAQTLWSQASGFLRDLARRGALAGPVDGLETLLGQ